MCFSTIFSGTTWTCAHSFLRTDHSTHMPQTCAVEADICHRFYAYSLAGAVWLMVEFPWGLIDIDDSAIKPQASPRQWTLWTVDSHNIATLRYKDPGQKSWIAIVLKNRAWNLYRKRRLRQHRWSEGNHFDFSNLSRHIYLIHRHFQSMEVSALLEGHRNQGPVILAPWFWPPSGLSHLLATVVFFLRLLTRIRILHNAGLDDAIIGFSLVGLGQRFRISWRIANLDQICAIICSGIMIPAVSSGLGRHPYYSRPAAISKAVKLSLILEPFSIIAFSLPKFAVAITLTQIMPPNKLKAWFLYCLTASQTVSAVIACMVFFVHCSPTRALWTPAISADTSCWPPWQRHAYTTCMMIFAFVVFVRCFWPSVLAFSSTNLRY